jgi:hypothetical protein
MTKLIPEILGEFDKCKKKQQRVDVLNKYSTHPHFPWVMDFTFNDRYEFLLPQEGDFPEYKEDDSPIGLSPQNLGDVLKRVYLFLKGHPGADGIPQIKRETIFLEMLETIHPSEVEVLKCMVRKKSPTKFLTKALLEEVYPKMFNKKE